MSDGPDPIYVTRPFMPPLEEFLPFLERIWDSRQLTNSGPFHQELEDALAAYLGVDHLALFANGTLALVTALQALRISGEVITSPFSFVATSHALMWNGITPVFVDVDPGTCNLDATKIERAITPATSAILAVHCYGTPCDTEGIQRVADAYGLKVIYDAAHAFGVRSAGQSLLRHGDLSMVSFHATKVYTTFEGGALVCPDAKTKQRVDFLKNFGHSGEVNVVAPGINGKLTEIQAAFGLLQLRYVDEALERRATVARQYRRLLADVPGIRLLSEPDDVTTNHAYFPIFVEAPYPLPRDALFAHLRERGIVARRYFYPLIAEFPMYRGLPSADLSGLPVAHQLSSSVLCLPIYPDLAASDVERIAKLIACPQG